MRKCHVSELSGNEILAQSVYLENGQILLEAGTKIDESYKESLVVLNVGDIFIKDRYEEYERPNFYLEKEKISYFKKELKEILSHHVYKDNRRLKKIKNLAEKMSHEICRIEGKKIIDIPERNADLYEHLVYTTMWSLILGKELNFSEEKMKFLALGGLLHDLGLYYINVNYKNCHLEEMIPTEIFELKKHTILAYTALEKETWIPEISKKMILSHHEKSDGSGYPLKQKNQETECKIIQICDTFDSIICGIERKKDSLSKAFEEIEDNRKYDAEMAEILKKRIARYPVGSRLILENDISAVVISQTEDSLYPEIIKIGKDIKKERLSEKVFHII